MTLPPLCTCQESCTHPWKERSSMQFDFSMKVTQLCRSLASLSGKRYAQERVTHQKKNIKRIKRKILGGDQKKILRVSKQKYCTYKIAANLGREVKTSAPWGIKKKILLEIHVEGRRSRNTSLRSALIFPPVASAVGALSFAFTLFFCGLFFCRFHCLFRVCLRSSWS